jgi:chlorite dismutase
MPEDVEGVEISEKGLGPDGRRLTSERRLFMQLLAFGNCVETRSLVMAAEKTEVAGVLYEDINDPQGVALLAFCEDPGEFISHLRPVLNSSPFQELRQKPEYTMLGRTYSLGYEPDLDEALIHRPIRKVLDPEMPWAIWYPLRRAGSFERLSVQEQRVILMEHGGVGRAFGKAGLGTDIRLACHGLDKEDNDFVIGLIGPELFPLSAIVQRMRKTKQTSLHLDSLGPFFVGRAVWQKRQKR